jgi:nitrate/nitrite transporter NarK
LSAIIIIHVINVIISTVLIHINTCIILFVAVASLLPYLAVYMKHIGLSPSETAIIYGVMPFLGAIVRPLFGAVADKLQKHKLVLMLCCFFTGIFHCCLLWAPVKDGLNVIPTNLQQASLICNRNQSFIK